MMLPADDRVALHDLVHRYAANIDRGEFAAATALFAHDGVLRMPASPQHLDPAAEHIGHFAIDAALRALEDVPMTVHEILGTVFDPGPAPGEATGRVVCSAHHLTQRAEGTSDLLWHLHYDDHYTYVDGTWLFASRAGHIDFIETRKPRVSRVECADPPESRAQQTSRHDR